MINNLPKSKQQWIGNTYYNKILKYKGKTRNVLRYWDGKDLLWCCTIDDCRYKYKHKSNLKQHKADKHGIDVTWYYCTIGDCKEKFKRKGTLKIHKADKHDIDVTWYYCTIGDCKQKFKRKGTFKNT